MIGVALSPRAAGTLMLDKTHVALGVAKLMDTVTATRAGSGLLEAVSSNPYVAKVRIDDNRLIIEAVGSGTCQITVSVRASAHHKPSARRTIAVNCDLPSKTLAECTWTQIRQATDAGVADMFWTLGQETALVPFKGTLQGDAFDTKFRFRVHRIMPNRITLAMSTNADGVEVALCTSNYGQLVSANGHGLCFNRMGQIGNHAPDESLSTGEKQHGTNRGGYAKSYLANSVMPECEECMPQELRNNARISEIWSDNTGNCDNTVAVLSPNRQKFYVPSICEANSTKPYINEFLPHYIEQWPVLLTQTRRNILKPNDAAIIMWYRDPDIYSVEHGVIRDTDKRLVVPDFAAYSYAITPVFEI